MEMLQTSNIAVCHKESSVFPIFYIILDINNTDITVQLYLKMSPTKQNDNIDIIFYRLLFDRSFNH